MTSRRTRGAVRSGWTRPLCLGSACTVLLLLGSVALADGDAVAVRVLEDSGDRIVLDYLVKDYSFTPVALPEGTFSIVHLGEEPAILKAGSPDLPRVCRSVIIPDRASMSVRILRAEYRDFTDVAVAPSKGDLLRTVDPATVPYSFGPAYSTDAFYPPQLAALGEPYMLRNERGMVVVLNPFQYNPVSQTLRLYTHVTLEVVNTGVDTVNVPDRPAPRPETSLAFHELYSHHFLNYTPELRYVPLDETGAMLIICYDAWLPNIQPLVEHKNGIGIPTTAVGVSTIGNNSTAIKNYIQNVYNTSDLAFVLLVGDSTQVATPSASGGSSDPTYSKLAGSDNYPEILVGRFSAETAAQVDTQALRSMEYELNQATLQPWFWKATGIASEQGAGIGDDGEADWVHMNNIRTDLLANGYTQVDQIYATNGGTAAQVSAALNAGRGFINYCGHGSTTSWSTTGFSNSNVTALVNDNMLPFIVSVACVNGQFAGYTCFAEAWLRATHNGEPTGAIGAYMSSINQSWAPPMSAQDETVDLLLAEAYVTYGALCFAGSCRMMDEYGSGGVEMFDTWHVFGDPSLRVVGVTEPPTGLKVTPHDGFGPAGAVGGPFNPGAMEYVLENKNDTPLDYAVSSGVSWLSLSNASGTLPPLGTITVEVTVNGAADSLAHGTHLDSINFVNTTDHDGDTSRDVSLQAGGPAWDPVAYNVSTSTGVSMAVNLTLNGSDPNGDPLTYVITSLPAQGALKDVNGSEITSVPYALLNGGQVVTYQPPCGAALSASFSYEVHDATATSNTATAGLTVTSAGPRLVYNFLLDSDPGWSAEGSWAFGQPLGLGSHNHDASSGHTGANVYGYNLGGDYANNLPARHLTTTALNCSSMSDVVLRYWRWLGVERFDRARVQVSTDNANWTTVWENPAGTSLSDASWSQQILDISALADGQPTVYIRWSMGLTDSNTTYPGWNVDDVELWGVVPAMPSDFNGDGLVNLADVPALVECTAGPGIEASFDCLCKDLDADGDVDLSDFAVFQQSFEQSL